MIPEFASLSDREKYETLMQSCEIGDCKTFDLCQRLRQLLSNENSESFFFRQIFLQKLPPGIQQIFAMKCSPVASLHQLVEKGDRAYGIHSNYQTISPISSPQVPVHSAAPFSSQSMEDRLTLMERKITVLRMGIQRLRSIECHRSRKNIRNPIQNAYQRHVLLSRQRRNCSSQVPTAS